MTPDGAKALPCPFCGQVPEAYADSGLGHMRVNLRCPDFRGYDWALEKWNRRAPDPDPATQRVVEVAQKIADAGALLATSYPNLIGELREALAARGG